MQAMIFETLKTVLRARRITYAELAHRLGISEPTVKRIFAARDDKLSRIIEICGVLDLSLDDIIAQSKRTVVAPLDLGDCLETKLAMDPSAFHLFILLLDGMPASEIERQFALGKETMFRLGQRLERMGLAEVQEAGRIRLLVKQPIQFRRDGPLHRSLMKINLDFIRSVFLTEDSDDSGFLTQSRRISTHTAGHMMREIRQLNRDLSEMARQDQLTLSGDELRSYKLCVAWSSVTFSRLLKLEPA